MKERISQVTWIHLSPLSFCRFWINSSHLWWSIFLKKFLSTPHTHTFFSYFEFFSSPTNSFSFFARLFSLSIYPFLLRLLLLPLLLPLHLLIRSQLSEASLTHFSSSFTWGELLLSFFLFCLLLVSSTWPNGRVNPFHGDPSGCTQTNSSECNFNKTIIGSFECAARKDREKNFGGQVEIKYLLVTCTMDELLFPVIGWRFNASHINYL